jgi:hypothetical protein
MRKSVRHIAFLLLIFIAYPFVFQTLHVISHDHGHTRPVRSGIVNGQLHDCTFHHDKSHDPAGQDDNSHKPVPAGQQFSGTHEHPGHEHCPLCEHEFAKFSIETLFQVSYTDDRFSLVNNYCYNNPPVLYNGNHCSLRAPPPA